LTLFAESVTSVTYARVIVGVLALAPPAVASKPRPPTWFQAKEPASAALAFLVPPFRRLAVTPTRRLSV
jgi:hypothetical protein